jgi:hypothetical protein
MVHHLNDFAAFQIIHSLKFLTYKFEIPIELQEANKWAHTTQYGKRESFTVRGWHR